MVVDFSLFVPYIGLAVDQSETSENKDMWNDLRTLQGIGSAVIECEGRSVFGGRQDTVLTKLLSVSRLLASHWKKNP